MAKNINVKKTRPFLTFLVVLLILALLAMVFAFVWKLSNGFSDWSWFKTESEVEEVEDEYIEEFSEFSSYIVVEEDPESPVASEDMYEVYLFDSSEEYFPEDFVLSGDVISDEFLNE